MDHGQPKAAERRWWFWVDPNPSGESRELMDFEQLREWCDDLVEQGDDPADVLTITMAYLTDAEVKALEF